ncbi:AMACR [Bugula neritina]|uniref:AMACR n=1 Tax=Bugula neritina TaxID=10212 RepID=A0A7J7JST8_BUGNE|nr:AMACR [Bugula neritina]
MALKGIRVIEMAGLAPGPFCGMVLADHGANVIRIDKLRGAIPDTLSRGKRSLAVDLKHTEGVGVVRKVCQHADVIIEPFRPGVMEKLGLGPAVLCGDNSKLIYARLTGFGQTGDNKHMAGHDINYIATSGVLSRFGRRDAKPTPPVNLMADFAGGGLMCAVGILLALLERTTSGKGQVIDCNMVQGSAYVSSFLWSSLGATYGEGLWGKPRGENLLDSGAPFYDTYKTKDGKYMAVGALEPQFYSILLEALGLDEDEYSQFGDWTALREKFTNTFATKTQSEWAVVFAGKDACVTPVVELEDAHKQSYNRHLFVRDDAGRYQPTPAPVLSRTPAHLTAGSLPSPGQHSTSVLKECGLTSTEIDGLISKGTIFQSVNSKL